MLNDPEAPPFGWICLELFPGILGKSKGLSEKIMISVVTFFQQFPDTILFLVGLLTGIRKAPKETHKQQELLHWNSHRSAGCRKTNRVFPPGTQRTMFSMCIGEILFMDHPFWPATLVGRLDFQGMVLLGCSPLTLFWSNWRNKPTCMFWLETGVGLNSPTDEVNRGEWIQGLYGI